MSSVQSDLEALRALQQDFENIKILKQQINTTDNKIKHIEKQCKPDKMPKEPELDRSKSEAMQKEVQELTTKTAGGEAAGLTFCLIAVAVIGLFTGSGFGKLWAVLGAGCAWLGCCFGLVPALVGCGLGVFIGWDAWVNAGIFLQIILGILTAASIVWAHIGHQKDKKIKPQVEQKGKEIYEQQKAEDAAFALAKEEYKQKLIASEEEFRALSRRVNKELYDEMESLREQLRAAKDRIANNPVLDDSDKKEEVIEFVISQLQRKRAVSLTDALQQYDAMVRQREEDRLDYENRKLQMDMERMRRDEEILRNADAQWNQAMHNMRMEKEQRRQTKILEEISENLDK